MAKKKENKSCEVNGDCRKSYEKPTKSSVLRRVQVRLEKVDHIEQSLGSIRLNGIDSNGNKVKAVIKPKKKGKVNPNFNKLKSVLVLKEHIPWKKVGKNEQPERDIFDPKSAEGIWLRGDVHYSNYDDNRINFSEFSPEPTIMIDKKPDCKKKK